jgi:hypothetical protein
MRPFPNRVERTTRCWLPRNRSNAVEANQAEFGAQPEITVRRLRNCVDEAFEKAVADRPRSVRVLIDVQSRV